jgi:hypothetical protein
MDMVLALIVNVLPSVDGVVAPSGVIVTVATCPLAVPLTIERPGPHPLHVMIEVPVTVDPLCVNVIVIGVWGPPTLRP